MKQTIILKTEEDKKRASAVLAHLKLEPVHEVVIREHKKDRSAAANALMWCWLTIIANELGETKEEMHEIYKGKYLVNIFERDDKDFAEMIGTLRSMWQSGMKKEAEGLRKKIVSLVSTTQANTHQFSEYLESIEKDAASMNIVLPHPDDYYYEAMGVRR